MLAILLCQNLNAEPSRPIQHLMDERASLFDVGMHNLRLYLHSYRDGFTGISPGTAKYDWSPNRLEVSAVYVLTPERIRQLSEQEEKERSVGEVAEERCEWVLLTIRRWLDLDGDETVSPYLSSRLRSIFSHEGEMYSDGTDAVVRELQNILVLVGSVMYREGKPDPESDFNPVNTRLTCKQMLADEDVYFSKEPLP